MANPSDQGELFRIDDGVRRSKAAEILGRQSILARIKRIGQPDEVREISLDSLRSPKSELPADRRFLDNSLKRARRGQLPPPIEVVPMSREVPGLIPVRDVNLLTPTNP